MLIFGALALGGCGFEPVYAPGGAGEQLAGKIAVQNPANSDQFHFVTRIEERLGRASNPSFNLTAQFSTATEALGNTSLGDTTRYRLIGSTSYQLLGEDGAQVTSGREEAFTGYNTIGSTVATLAAERDARQRLMVLLADQVIDALILDLTGRL